MLICSASLAKVSLVSILHFSYGAQFLNATFVSALPPVTVTPPVTKTYASELLKTLLDCDVNNYPLIHYQ